MAQLSFTLLLSLTLFTITITITKATNITQILSSHPEYSDFNSLLTQTKLSDDINSRTPPITICLLSNSALSSLKKQPLPIIKNILALHVLLDYFDAQKLHKIPDGSLLSTTLYQTTGNADSNIGFVNISNLHGGKVAFGSGVPGSPLDSSFTKSVTQIPYNLSVIEIDHPIVPAALLKAPMQSSDVNITALLEKAGCKTFASLLVTTGVLKTYVSMVEKGLTIFAPNDEAFKEKGVPDLTKLTNAEVVSVLQYHALASYSPIGTLRMSKGKLLTTLAPNGAGKYDMSVTTQGDSVTLETGVNTSRVASTVLDSTPLCIFTVDSLLLPVELFGKAPAPAPSPGSLSAPAPSPAADAPASVEAPTPIFSPPAPPMGSPDGAPTEGPMADSENSTSENVAGVLEKPMVIVTVVVSVFGCFLLS